MKKLPETYIFCGEKLQYNEELSLDECPVYTCNYRGFQVKLYRHESGYSAVMRNGDDVVYSHDEDGNYREYEQGNWALHALHKKFIETYGTH